jgi:hypothetical protein
MNRASRSKGGGYLVSTISVILLAAVAWKGASKDPVLLVCLILGALTSIVGMGLRWRAFRIGQYEKEALKREVRQNSR